MHLEQQTNYILSFDDNLEIPALLKAVGIKHEEMEDDFFEKIRVNPISERLTPFEQKYSPKTRK